MFRLISLLSSASLLPMMNAQVILNEVMTSNESTALVGFPTGEFPDWIELRNTSNNAIDLSGWSLNNDSETSNQWIFPAGTSIAANGFLVIGGGSDGETDALGNLRINFGINQDGDFISLRNASEDLISTLNPGRLGNDESFGIRADTGAEVYLSAPTPGSANGNSGQPRTQGLTFSPERGYYDSAQTVTLTTIQDGASIYYTTDGSEPFDQSGNPGASATEYTSPIIIGSTTPLRAASILPNSLPSPSQTHSYFLFEIENTQPDGSGPLGLNAPFQNQTQPSGYANLSSGDYNMDPRISRSTSTTDSGIEGLTVAQALLRSLQDIATISITLPNESFAGSQGIYTNSQSQGIEWERACSAEFIPAPGDPRPTFQENCGLRVQGGASRIPSRSPKHSLSFRFRREYGNGRLNYPLFPESKVEEFNTIALRAFYNNSWIHFDAGQRSRASMIRDQWMRDSMREMGNNDAGYGLFAHVFINGLYFGVHNVTERQDNTHYANYNGGDAELIDARNGANFVNGDQSSFDAMRATVMGGDWAAIQQVLDVDNYIDFQILQRFAGNDDLKVDGNWRAAGGGPNQLPWRLYSWDGERVLESFQDNIVPLDPFDIRDTLENIPEYQQRYTDRAHLHLTSDGALTPEKCESRWLRHASALNLAVHAESARWGDHRENSPRDRSDWLRQQRSLLSTLFPRRTDFIIEQLQSSNLFPDTPAPKLLAAGLEDESVFLPSGQNLVTQEVAGATLYFTTDGSDPQLPNDNPAPTAISYTPQFSTNGLINFAEGNWSYLDTAVAQPASWITPGFDDSAWPTGQAPLGAGSIADATLNTTLNLGPNNSTPTFYFRKKFTVTNASEISSLRLQAVRDDGLVVYLNGVELFRENIAPGPVAFTDYANAAASESTLAEAEIFLTPGMLQEGENLIAIELHNRESSNDLGLDLSLIGVSSTDGGIPAPNSGLIKARFRLNGEWSPLTSTNLTREPLATGDTLYISEINYSPRDITLADQLPLATDFSNRDLFEFIEVTNSGNSAINLAGVQFTEGIGFTFPVDTLGVGESRVVVRDIAAFQSRYGSSIPIAGTYTGNLDNGGERLTLVNSSGIEIETLRYRDDSGWPGRANGGASSLERIDALSPADDPDSWFSSISYHGNPGSTGPTEDQRVVINEVASNSGPDVIELLNRSGTSLDLSGWLLSDDNNHYDSFRLASGTSLASSSYLTVSENEFRDQLETSISNYSGNLGNSPTTVTSSSHGLSTGDLITITGYGGFSEYDNTWEVTVIDSNTFTIPTRFLDNDSDRGDWNPGRNFGLSSVRGEDIWLLETNSSGDPISFVDRVEFSAARSNETLGRWPDGAGDQRLVPLTTASLNSQNAAPVIGSVLLSEVHYRDEENFEFVEITNRDNSSVSLDGWRLRGGADFDFADGQSIAAGESLVLVFFDPNESTLATAFRNRFNLDSAFSLLGPMTDGPLGDEAGTVRLEEGLSNPEAKAFVDEVRYLANAPWPSPTSARSLQRLIGFDFGRFAESWTSTLPTPGSLLPPSEDFAAWASTRGITNPLADPDGDGVDNLVEFALGLDPNSAGSAIQLNGGELTFPINLAASGINVELMSSTDLQTWLPMETEGIVISANSGLRNLPIDLENQPDRFFRIEVTEQNAQ